MKVQRTKQELYKRYEKLYKIFDAIWKCLLVPFCVCQLIKAFNKESPVWFLVVSISLSSITLAAIVIYFGYGVKLRRLKNQIDGMEDTREQEAEHEKE